MIPHSASLTFSKTLDFSVLKPQRPKTPLIRSSVFSELYIIMAFGVYYRFKSEKTFSFLPIEGSSITLLCFKRMVFEKKSMAKGRDYDLLVTNAQTNQEYALDTDVIPAHTAVLIRRIPGLPRAPIVVEPSKPLADVSAKTEIAVQERTTPAADPSPSSTLTSATLSRGPAATNIPPELCCPLCTQVMKDAVLASKCCFKSFCDKCIRKGIATKSACVCGATNISADDLLPNRTLRDTITRILAKSTTATTTNGPEATPNKSVDAPVAKEVHKRIRQDEKPGRLQVQQAVDHSKLNFPSLEGYNTYWDGRMPPGFNGYGYVGAGLPCIGYQSRECSLAAQSYMISSLLPRDLSELATNSIGSTRQGHHSSRNKLKPRKADLRKSNNCPTQQTPAKCKELKYPSMIQL